MFIPFSIKFTSAFSSDFKPEKKAAILQYLHDFMLSKKADDIVIEEDRLSFRSKFFKWGRLNTNILVPIERGIFVIRQENGNTVLTYEFFMYHLFIAVTLMSVLMALVSQQVRFGIICFAWLGGMNWLIALIRHRMMFTAIVRGVEQHITASEKKAGNTDSAGELQNLNNTHTLELPRRSQ